MTAEDLDQHYESSEGIQGLRVMEEPNSKAENKACTGRDLSKGKQNVLDEYRLTTRDFVETVELELKATAEWRGKAN